MNVVVWAMAVLIVESVRELGRVWQSAIERLGADVELATSQSDAISKLMETEFDIIVMNVVLGEGSAFAVSDFVNYRWPGKPIFFVTSTSFFRMALSLICAQMPVHMYKAIRHPTTWPQWYSTTPCKPSDKRPSTIRIKTLSCPCGSFVFKRIG